MRIWRLGWVMMLCASSALAAEDAPRKISSICFPPTRIEALRASIVVYQQTQEALRQKKEQENAVASTPTTPAPPSSDDFLTQLTDSAKQIVQPAAKINWPTYRLDSIVVHQSREWAVWVNSKKIDSYTQGNVDGLAVQEVSQYRIRAWWYPGKLMTQAREKWLALTSDERARMPLDEDRQAISILLYPNQVFVPEQMQVVEGKGASVASAAPAASPAAPAASPAAVVPAPPAVTPPPPAQDAVKPPVTGDDTGLAGLIKRNQKIVNP